MHFLHQQLDSTTYAVLLRLFVAAILGGIIGLEREFRHKPSGLRTNMFICFGSALFTIMSDRLASNWGGDHTRIAAQIIAGIGFIGAGSILHDRGSISGLTSAATIYVSAAVGMATGGGQYIAAGFGTFLAIVSLVVLGRVEHHFESKRLRITYEVTGHDAESVIGELNRILAEQNLKMEDVHAAAMNGASRVVFAVSGLRQGYSGLTIRLHQSNVFFQVQTLDTGGAE
jgi:putative Mg2+ transporter-C (MgtC) family protein